MVSYDYTSGFRAIKYQIYSSMLKTGIGDISRYTFDLLNRTAPGWMKE